MIRNARSLALIPLVLLNAAGTYAVVDHLRPVWVQVTGAVMCLGWSVLSGASVGRWIARGV